MPRAGYREYKHEVARMREGVSQFFAPLQPNPEEKNNRHSHAMSRASDNNF